MLKDALFYKDNYLKEFEAVVEIAISTSIIEIMIALMDTPFLYASKLIKEKESL